MVGVGSSRFACKHGLGVDGMMALRFVRWVAGCYMSSGSTHVLRTRLLCNW